MGAKNEILTQEELDSTNAILDAIEKGLIDEPRSFRQFGGDFKLILNKICLTDNPKLKTDRMNAKKELKAYLKGKKFYRTFPEGNAGQAQIHSVRVITE